MGGYVGASYELSGGASSEPVPASRLSPEVFSTLGVRPEIGRVFTRQEDEGHERVAVISYALWQNRYNRDPRILGTAIQLDRKAYTIVGVMPRTFEFPVDSTRLNQAQPLGAAQPHSPMSSLTNPPECLDITSSRVSKME